MPVLTSTDYYRKNKEEGKVMHKCPHCDFTTPYNKSNLMNHIYAKHTPEHERPFQCRLCERGFSQKSHLISHLKKVHKTSDSSLETKTVNVLYHISVTDKIPKYKKTKLRREYYKNHNILKSRDMSDNKYEYANGLFISNNEIHYDKKNGFITFKKINLTGKIKLPCKCKTCIIAN